MSWRLLAMQERPGPVLLWSLSWKVHSVLVWTSDLQTSHDVEYPTISIAYTLNNLLGQCLYITHTDDSNCSSPFSH